jgi:hypothetical protein
MQTLLTDARTAQVRTAHVSDFLQQQQMPQRPPRYPTQATATIPMGSATRALLAPQQQLQLHSSQQQQLERQFADFLNSQHR